MTNLQVPPAIKVAQYLRKSTDLQKYSIENQRVAIAKFAAENGMEVVQSFEDHGKSGLTLNGREGLKELLQTVVGPRRRFDSILVYDVSRWGRFQDADESAFYEYLCRRAGVDVIYCAETFNVPGPMGVVIKSVKRAMAAEYSKELSARVYASMLALAHRGHHTGGPAGFALKRVQVSEDGLSRRDLSLGERKSRLTDHVELMPGNEWDCGLVRLIFHLFVRCRLQEYEIAAQLNWNCYPSRVGLGVWRAHAVRAVLRNEQYIGTKIYGAYSQRLKGPAHHVPRDQIIRTPKSFEPIVSPELFMAAQQLVGERKPRRHWSDEELLDVVRQASREGTYVYALPRGRPSTAMFTTRFGSLADAYKAAGITPPDRTVKCGLHYKHRQQIKSVVYAQLAEHVRGGGKRFYLHPTSRRACIGGRLTISIRVAHPNAPNGYWELRPDLGIRPDACLFVRSSEDGAVLDYYLIPGNKNRNGHVRSDGSAIGWLRKYHCPTWTDLLARLDGARPLQPTYIPSSFRYYEERGRREASAPPRKLQLPPHL